MENLAFLKEYHKRPNDAGGYGNMVLYRMCMEEPSHKDCGTVGSKLWLIGRAYAASPQRGSGQAKNSKQEDFFLWLAEPLVKDNWLDKRLEKLNNENRFSEQTFREILKIHHQFEKRLRKRLDERQYIPKPEQVRYQKKARAQRSFCSKYLHFHCPDHFPIFDSIVSTAMKEKYRHRRLEMPKSADQSYARYCMLMLRYIDDEAPETLRQADRQLYGLE